jgi:hypothetical protein
MSDAVAAAAGLGAAQVPSPGTPAACSLGEAAPAGTPEKRKRPARPKIDIDARSTDLAKDILAAQKLLKETKTSQRNERRKKQRLIKKAAGLRSTDLERIAVIRRCGLWEPGQGVTFAFSGTRDNPAGKTPALGEAALVTDVAGPIVLAVASAAASAAASGESEEEDVAAARVIHEQISLRKSGRHDTIVIVSVATSKSVSPKPRISSVGGGGVAERDGCVENHPASHNHCPRGVDMSPQPLPDLASTACVRPAERAAHGWAALSKAKCRPESCFFFEKTRPGF